MGVRTLTVFLYLNDVEEGGGTGMLSLLLFNTLCFDDSEFLINTCLALEFPNLNLVVQPKKGSALIWPSVLNEDPNKKDERTEHGALPVKKGVKYGANAWIHQRGTLQIACSEKNIFNILIFSVVGRFQGNSGSRLCLMGNIIRREILLCS